MMVAHDVNPILGYLDRVVYIAGGGRRPRARRPRSITSETLTPPVRHAGRGAARPPTAGSSSSASPRRRRTTAIDSARAHDRHEHVH